MILDDITKDVEYYRNKDSIKMSICVYLKTYILNYENKAKSKLTENEIQQLLIKERNKLYQNRIDSNNLDNDYTMMTIRMINKYLPSIISDFELDSLILKSINDMPNIDTDLLYSSLKSELGCRVDTHRLKQRIKLIISNKDKEADE